MDDGIHRQLSLARSEISEVCRLLQSPTPESLNQSALHLETALQAMMACPASPEAGEEDGLEAQQLQNLVRQAGRLLDAGWEFRRNWFRRLSTMTSGYAPGGEPAAMDRGCSVIVNG
jgi:hypothetical protein